MGRSHLWVIDRDGRVFLFSVRDKSWRQISTPELGSRNCFKRVSAVEQCAWAISANQQPYVFVHATELPIRVKVQTYENQRWGIVNGWSKKSVRRCYFYVAYMYFTIPEHVNYQPQLNARYLHTLTDSSRCHLYLQPRNVFRKCVFCSAIYRDKTGRCVWH